MQYSVYLHYLFWYIENDVDDDETFLLFGIHTHTHLILYYGPKNIIFFLSQILFAEEKKIFFFQYNNQKIIFKLKSLHSFLNAKTCFHFH